MGNLATPKSVQKLQTALHAKAKAEAGYRFYALYDKISRDDIRACLRPVPLQQGRARRSPGKRSAPITECQRRPPLGNIFGTSIEEVRFA